VKVVPNGTRFAHCYFRAQRSLDFQGPPLPMAFKMDFLPSKSLCPAPYKQQVLPSMVFLDLRFLHAATAESVWCLASFSFSICIPLNVALFFLFITLCLYINTYFPQRNHTRNVHRLRESIPNLGS
jgi:hypothetical protein